jgi:hypothetical protein
MQSDDSMMFFADCDSDHGALIAEQVPVPPPLIPPQPEIASPSIDPEHVPEPDSDEIIRADRVLRVFRHYYFKLRKRHRRSSSPRLLTKQEIDCFLSLLHIKGKVRARERCADRNMHLQELLSSLHEFRSREIYDLAQQCDAICGKTAFPN